MTNNPRNESRPRSNGEMMRSGSMDDRESSGAATPLDEERTLVGRYFDSAYYLSCNADVAESSRDPLEHFLKYGWREGRNPAPWFHISEYLDCNPEVQESQVNPFYHFLLVRQKVEKSHNPESLADIQQGQSDFDLELERSIIAPYFDSAYYLARNADVAAAGLDPLQHFLEYGWREKRNPTPWFDIQQYLEHRPDVGYAKINPFYYFLLDRQRPSFKRPSHSSPDRPHRRNIDSAAIVFQRSIVAPYFDADYYLDTYADVAASGVDPLDHFVTEGWQELRNPNGRFNVAEYLRLNEDVRAANLNPFYHYLIAGKAEQRPTKSQNFAEIKMIMAARSMTKRAAEDGKPAHLRAALSKDSLRFFISGLLSEVRNKVILSLSHDEYVYNSGGIQNCIAQEQRESNIVGFSYIHLSPGSPSLHFVEKEAQSEVISIIIDGNRVGYAKIEDLICCMSDIFREKKLKSFLVIHSVLGFSLRFISALHTALQPHRSSIWIHDCSTLCTNYAMLRNDVEFCWAPPIDSSACTVCVYGVERREHLMTMHRLFEILKPAALFPSEVMRDFWQERSTFPITEASVVPHAAPRFTAERRPSLTQRSARVAFVGIPAPHKGWHVFHDLAEQFRFDPRYKFYHFASRSGPKTPAIDFIETTVNAHEPNAMIDALQKHDIDVVVQWSLCFETFSFATLEAILAGTLIAAKSDSGNAAVLVTRYKAGIVLDDKYDLVDLFSTGKILEHLRLRRTASVPVGELELNKPNFAVICGAEERHG